MVLFFTREMSIVDVHLGCGRGDVKERASRGGGESDVVVVWQNTFLGGSSAKNGKNTTKESRDLRNGALSIHQKRALLTSILVVEGVRKRKGLKGGGGESDVVVVWHNTLLGGRSTIYASKRG